MHTLAEKFLRLLGPLASYLGNESVTICSASRRCAPDSPYLHTAGALVVVTIKSRVLCLRLLQDSMYDGVATAIHALTVTRRSRFSFAQADLTPLQSQAFCKAVRHSSTCATHTTLIQFRNNLEQPLSTRASPQWTLELPDHELSLLSIPSPRRQLCQGLSWHRHHCLR